MRRLDGMRVSGLDRNCTDPKFCAVGITSVTLDDGSGHLFPSLLRGCLAVVTMSVVIHLPLNGRVESGSTGNCLSDSASVCLFYYSPLVVFGH